MDGELSKEDNKDEQALKNLLRYINKSTRANVIDDNTRKLDGIVSITKSRKEIGIRYMKSWERERQVREEGRAEGKLELIEEMLKNGDISAETADKMRRKLSEPLKGVKRDGSF